MRVLWSWPSDLLRRGPQIVVAAILLLGQITAPALSQPADDVLETALCSENIAKNALRVAEKTNTSGYCYAAVTKALKPLGVALSGRSAFMAKDLLIRDSRFSMLNGVYLAQLKPGDLIVYNANSVHPHGHIAVYEGFESEASDHIAALTPVSGYGGATVFRLKSEYERWNPEGRSRNFDQSIALAPDFRSAANNGYRGPETIKKVDPALSAEVINRFESVTEKKHQSRYLRIVKSKVIHFLLRSL